MSEQLNIPENTDPSESVANAVGPFLGASSGTISLVGLFGEWMSDRWVWGIFLIAFMGLAGAILHPKWVAMKKTPDWMAAASASIYLPPTALLVMISGGIDSPYWVLFIVGSISSGFAGKGLATKYIVLGAVVALGAMAGPSLALGLFDVDVFLITSMRLICILTVGHITYRSVLEIENILIKRAETETVKLRKEQELREAELRTELIERQSTSLRKAHEELTKASKLRDEFLANMSHELRTPLNSILGVAEALSENVYGELAVSQRDSLETIEKSGRHLLELINNVLDVSKIEAGKFVLNRQETRLSVVVNDAAGLLKTTAQLRQLTMDIPPVDARILINCDSLRLRQVLVNLIGNALKFTPAGGTVGVEIEFKQESSTVAITVWDTGIGVSEEAQKTLFEAFVQAPSEGKLKTDGTGLGLTLVSNIVDLHGGRVELQSVPEKGSRFTIELPQATLSEKTEDVRLSHAYEESRKKRPKSTGLCVLIVDDNPNNIPHVRDYLLSLAYRVETASNGVEALEKARNCYPALILLDMQMPQMSGFDVLKHREEDEELRMIPVVAVTALASAEDEKVCLESGADAFLSKPFRLAELLNVVRTHARE